MSKSATAILELQLYIPQPDYESPYPVGEWRAAGPIVGDATGGYLQAVFAPSSALQSKNYLWSWESASVRYRAALVAALPVLLEIVTAEPFAGAVSNEFYAAWDAVGPVTNVYGGLQLAGGWPAALNRIIQPRAGLTPSWSIALDGNPNGVTVDFAGWGYVWHPQARTRAGGPKRP